jgi:hypothetical protein
LFFRKKADRNIDQAPRRAPEGQQDDQDAEIEEHGLPRRPRQGARSGADGGTVNRHDARFVLWRWQHETQADAAV